MDVLKTIIILISVFLIISVLYIFATAPRMQSKAKKNAAKFKGKYIAHRGLHSAGIHENTADAFRAAVSAGYGFEFDVRVSSDNVPVIAHDSNLKRVFGVDRRVEEMTASELTKIGVPTLAETLEIADGKVPLVVELKMDDASFRVCELSAPLLSAYKGDYCVESFHPVALKRWKKLMPDDTRGQLSALFKKSKGFKEKYKYFILRNLLTNYATRPDFIAYEFKGARRLSLRICRALGATAVAWTIRSQEELDANRKYFDTFIFENFIPV